MIKTIKTELDWRPLASMTTQGSCISSQSWSYQLETYYTLHGWWGRNNKNLYIYERGTTGPADWKWKSGKMSWSGRRLLLCDPIQGWVTIILETDVATCSWILIQQKWSISVSRHPSALPPVEGCINCAETRWDIQGSWHSLVRNVVFALLEPDSPASCWCYALCFAHHHFHVVLGLTSVSAASKPEAQWEFSHQFTTIDLEDGPLPHNMSAKEAKSVASIHMLLMAPKYFTWWVW